MRVGITIVERELEGSDSGTVDYSISTVVTALQKRYTGMRRNREPKNHLPLCTLAKRCEIFRVY